MLIYPRGFIVVSLPCGLRHRVERLGHDFGPHQSYHLPLKKLWLQTGVQGLGGCQLTVGTGANNIAEVLYT